MLQDLIYRDNFLIVLPTSSNIETEEAGEDDLKDVSDLLITNLGASEDIIIPTLIVNPTNRPASGKIVLNENVTSSNVFPGVDTVIGHIVISDTSVLDVVCVYRIQTEKNSKRKVKQLFLTVYTTADGATAITLLNVEGIFSSEKKKEDSLLTQFKKGYKVFSGNTVPYLVKKGLGHLNLSAFDNIRSSLEGVLMVKYIRVNKTKKDEEASFFKHATIQTISPTGEKKFSGGKGSYKGSFVMLHGDLLNQTSGYVFIVEGLATGLSVIISHYEVNYGEKCPLDGRLKDDMEVTILCTGGSGNFRNMLQDLFPLIKQKSDSVDFIYCGEIDKTGSSKTEFQKALKEFPIEGLIREVYPIPIDDKSTDFNDIYCRFGFIEVLEELFQ